MNKRCFAALLALLLVVMAVAGCSSDKPTEKDRTLSPRSVARKDLGAAMPEILFAHEGKVAFWGSFGLFIVNAEDGSIYRSLDIEGLKDTAIPVTDESEKKVVLAQSAGYNHMGGELITRFLVSPDYQVIYMYNESDGQNVDNFFLGYDIEKETVHVIPVGANVEVLPEQPAFGVEVIGGEKEGYYTSNFVFLDESHTVYLKAEDWITKGLTLCIYNLETKETQEFVLF